MLSLARLDELAVVGEVAVVDLDAALGEARGLAGRGSAPLAKEGP